MTSIIDKATAHFESILAQGLMGPIPVPEWETEIYYKPASSMYEESKVMELAQAGKATEALIQTLIMRARDKDGNPMFQQADKLRLMRAVDPNVILRIVTSMNNTKKEAQEALGN